ncbi:Uncharacterised protein [uncultured archaeon]|nr:Uncharacterised protein [uncultured archaeon]
MAKDWGVFGTFMRALRPIGFTVGAAGVAAGATDAPFVPPGARPYLFGGGAILTAISAAFMAAD